MKRLLLSLIWLIPAGLLSQITIDETLTAQELVQDVLIGGSCAETSNFVSSTGTDFGEVNGIAAFDANGSDFPFQSGIILSSGAAADAPGPNLTVQGEGGWPGDADLEAATGAFPTNNASSLEFDFTPLTDVLSFNFIMASEEYNQNFECTFSDAFAFILTDIAAGTSENLAVLPGTTIPIEVTNIRPEVAAQCAAVNEEFFDRYNFLPFNDENTAATNFNGQTVTLTATSPVVVGNNYSIKLVVADQGDSAFDIAVFLESGSFNVGGTDLGEDILVANGNATCEGDSVTLDATDPAALSYVWFFNGEEIIGQTMATLEVVTAGTYSVQVALTDPADCVINDTIEVEFIEEDSIAIGEDLEVCEGDTAIFDTGLTTDAASFVWTLDGVIVDGETEGSIAAIAAGVYEVTATFEAGCVFSDDALLLVNTTPVVDLGEDINSCLEDPVTLDGTPSNVDPASVSYQWALNGTIIGGQTNPTLEVSTQGTYEVFVTLEGCTGSDVLIVNLANPDGSSCTVNNTCPEATVITCGDVVTGNTDGSTSEGAPDATCGTTSGAPGNWYSFIGTGEQVELALCNSDYDTKVQVYSGTCDALECVGGNDDSCGLQSEFDFLAVDGTEYFIYVFGFGSSTGNYEMTLECVEPVVVPSCIDADPFCSDEGLIFENVSNDSEAPEGIDYECLGSQPNPSWFFLEIQEAGDLDLEIVQNTAFDADGNPIGTPLDVDFIAWGPFDSVDAGCGSLSPATSVDCSFSAAPIENFTIPNALPEEIYIVLITNFNGDPGFISLGQSGGEGSTNCDIVQEFTVDLGEDRTFCSTTTEDFEIVPSITGEDLGEPTFLWSTGETTESITVSTTNTYTVEVTIDGFTATDEVTITFLEEPCVIAPDCIEISFEENFGTGTERASTPFTEYVFNGSTQINDGEYAIFNTSAGLNTGWHPEFEDHTPGDVNGRALFVNASFEADEFYRRTVDNLLPNENYIFDSWITTVYDTDTGICEAGGIPANVTFRIEDLAGTVLSEIETGDIPNEDAFNWQLFSIDFNSGANTSVQIVLINNSIGGCGNDLAIDDITLAFSGTSPDIIDGDAIELCDISGSTDLTTQIDTILNGEDPAEVEVSYHTSQFDAEAGNNPITAPEAYIIQGPQTIFIRVQRLDDTSCFAIATIDLIETSPMVDLGSDQVICNDGSFTIIPVLSGDTADFDFLWSTGETTETITVSESGVYELTITTAGLCTATDAIAIDIETAISVSLGEDFITCRDFSNTLNATVDASGATFQWFLNGEVIEGATGTTLDFTAGQSAMGTQEYTLVVTSARGCTSEGSIEVSLYDVGQCVISEGLSPTGSPGFNDSLDLTFLADRTGIASLQIFNRLGTLVYEQADYVSQWRGQTDAGGDLPTGTYFYLINFESEDPDFGTQSSGWIYINQE